MKVPVSNQFLKKYKQKGQSHLDFPKISSTKLMQDTLGKEWGISKENIIRRNRFDLFSKLSPFPFPRFGEKLLKLLSLSPNPKLIRFLSVNILGDFH